MDDIVRLPGAGPVIVSQVRYQVTLLLRNPRTLIAGVILVAGTAAWLNWYMFGLGIWLIAVAAFSGFAGPAGVWAVDALAVGLLFLLIAVLPGQWSRM